MLNTDGVDGINSFEKFQSEAVKIFDIQPLCFSLIQKTPTCIPARLISKPNNWMAAL